MAYHIVFVHRSGWIVIEDHQIGSCTRFDDTYPGSEKVTGEFTVVQIAYTVDIAITKGLTVARLVLVDVRLRKETPVKTDTRASLTLKGITGVVFIELNGGDPAAKSLLAVTPPDKVPEIPSEKTGLKAMVDDLPKLVAKFAAIEEQIKKVVAGVSSLTDKVKANPSLLLRRPEKSSNDAEKR